MVASLNFGQINSSSVERVFFVTSNAYYICCYNLEFEEVTQHQRVELYEISTIQRVRFASHEYGLKIHFVRKELYYNSLAVTRGATGIDEAFVENTEEGGGKYHIISPQVLDSANKEKSSEGFFHLLFHVFLIIAVS